MSETVMSMMLYGFCAIVVVVPMVLYQRRLKKRETQAQASAEKGKLHSSGPQSQHPHIDATYCIGCAACTMVCPEGDVLAMLGGKAVIVNGHKCIGHSLCAEVCPVGAITMVLASPSVGADTAYLTPEHETTIKNMFIVGELGGLALIKNAINQGRDCVDIIANRLSAMGPGRSVPGVYDVLIAGAGPGGISASLRSIEKRLNYLTVDEGEMGGTVAKYPRQKLVMTSPVEFPTYGKFKKTELSKEELLAFWNKVLQRTDFKFRKGVKGEDLPKVMYRLIEADHYINKKILVVGGGDSAVEAAMGLGHQVGNQVTLSYRKEAFSRLKERNVQRIEESVRQGKVKVIFNSSPVEFKGNSVVLEVHARTQEIPNDYVWIFAGGEPPTAFLKKIGVGFGMRDMTSEAGKEAREVSLSKKQLVEV